MKIKPEGTRQNVTHVTNNVGGHLSVTPGRKEEPIVKIKPVANQEWKPTKMSEEIENQLDKVGPKGDNELAIGNKKSELKKVTGDIKDNKGLAKASPKFKKVDPKAHASETDKEKAIKENTIQEDADNDN